MVLENVILPRATHATAPRRDLCHARSPAGTPGGTPPEGTAGGTAGGTPPEGGIRDTCSGDNRSASKPPLASTTHRSGLPRTSPGYGSSRAHPPRAHALFQIDFPTCPEGGDPPDSTRAALQIASTSGIPSHISFSQKRSPLLVVLIWRRGVRPLAWAERRTEYISGSQISPTTTNWDKLFAL